jgi:hypothetical protein
VNRVLGDGGASFMKDLLGRLRMRQSNVDLICKKFRVINAGEIDEKAKESMMTSSPKTYSGDL